jgi:hypothetical protein
VVADNSTPPPSRNGVFGGRGDGGVEVIRNFGPTGWSIDRIYAHLLKQYNVNIEFLKRPKKKGEARIWFHSYIQNLWNKYMYLCKDQLELMCISFDCKINFVKHLVHRHLVSLENINHRFLHNL